MSAYCLYVGLNPERSAFIRPRNKNKRFKCFHLKALHHQRRGREREEKLENIGSALLGFRRTADGERRAADATANGTNWNKKQTHDQAATIMTQMRR